MEERREEWTWKSTSSRRRTGRRSQAGQDDYPWSQAALGRMLRPGKGRPERGEKKGVTQQIVRESRYRCGFCRGEGKIGGTVCPVCKGKGTVSIMNPPAVVCAFCRGTGEAKRRSGITCLACKGKGIIPVVEPIEICDKCSGSGKEPTNKTLLCGKCKGAGVTSVGKGGARWMRSPSGTERDAAMAIYNLGGVAGRHAVGREIGLSVAYSEYVLKSMLQRGYIEKAGGAVYALTPQCEEIIAALVEKEELKMRIQEEKEQLKAGDLEAAKELIAPWELWES